MAFIGSARSSSALLETALTIECLEVVGIATVNKDGSSGDHVSLSKFADANSIPWIDVGDGRSDLEEWITGLAPDVAFCFGWNRILPSEVFLVPRLGTIGYHPAPLPRSRGRHPIIWTLVLGLSSTASTFFMIDEGVDTGAIVSQVDVTVEEDDCSTTLYNRLIHTAQMQLRSFAPALATNTLQTVPQDEQLASHWRGRTEADGRIDWRMSASTIYNLVRALRTPYPGATAQIGSEIVRIDFVVPILESEYPMDIRRMEYGRVVDIGRDCTVDIRCGDGVIRIVQSTLTTIPEIGTPI